mgnify:CR=1 FL=1
MRDEREATTLVRALPDWFARHELGVLLALLAAAVSIWGFAEIADEVIEGETDAVDRRVVAMLRSADNPGDALGPAWVEEVGRDITALGGMAVLTLITLAVLGYLLFQGRRHTAVFVVVAVCGGLALSTLLKWAYDRPRPDIVPHLSHVVTSSFPSGHAMNSAVVYLTLGVLLARLVQARHIKAYFLLLALMLTGLVGISRVYMGVHYPTDVLAGWAAGMAWATLCWLVARVLQKRGIIATSIV